MSKRPARRLPSQELAAAAAAYQASTVIPHCAVCARPCCRLDALVLELEWKQLKFFWHLDESRPAFDRRLASGQGPADVRAGNGLYYAHSKPCPAYDEAGHSCRAYDHPLKPVGCSDFPVYQDAGDVIADLRCEAVDLDALTAGLKQAVGTEYRIARHADEEFPFIVTLSAKPAKRSGNR